MFPAVGHGRLYSVAPVKWERGAVAIHGDRLGHRAGGYAHGVEEGHGGRCSGRWGVAPVGWEKGAVTVEVTVRASRLWVDVLLLLQYFST